MIACVLIVLYFNSIFVLSNGNTYQNDKYKSLRAVDDIPQLDNSEEPIVITDKVKIFHHHRPHHHHSHHSNHREDESQEMQLEFGIDKDSSENTVPRDASNMDAKFRYFISAQNFTELPLDQAKNIFSTGWYNASRNTIFFAHGFTGHPNGPAVTAIINTYLKYGNVNVVLLNWEKMAAGAPNNLASSYLSQAMPNTKKLGVALADVLLEMGKAGLDLNKTHFIGHSLGAHLFGITGNTLAERGTKLPWITGLDPASVGFDGRPTSTRLHAGSALFVTVIHSDPSKYGYSRPLGSVDFWPNFKNGAVTQPGCVNKPFPMFSPGDLCNHNRAWELLVDSIKHPGSLLGSFAKNFRKWKAYTSEERNANTLSIGAFEVNKIRGSYFLTTNSKEPFGRGRDGL